eukprot:366449-Chlamydomonas_euryale.AAC.26
MALFRASDSRSRMRSTSPSLKCETRIMPATCVSRPAGPSRGSQRDKAADWTCAGQGRLLHCP